MRCEAEPPEAGHEYIRRASLALLYPAPVHVSHYSASVDVSRLPLTHMYVTARYSTIPRLSCRGHPGRLPPGVVPHGAKLRVRSIRGFYHGKPRPI
jgi:hypothetical protein